MSLYESLDVQVTLRCNVYCKNCIKFSNMEAVTGLDYSDTDVSLLWVARLRDELAALSAHGKVIDTLCLTGGEPTLHPDILDIVNLLKPLVPWVVGQITINSNLIMPEHLREKLAPYLINYSIVKDKPQIHSTVLLHPSEIQADAPTFAGCTHYRKWRPVVNVYGYSMCCAADGYIRLFGLDELIIPKLPVRPEGFPLSKMDLVCNHCPFGCRTEVFERDEGRPVSAVYQQRAEQNRQKLINLKL